MKLQKSIEENNQYFFYSLQEDIDEIAKNYMEEYFSILVAKRYQHKIEIENLNHYDNLKRAEMEIFFENVFKNITKNKKGRLELFDKNRKHLKKGSYPVLICFLNTLYKNLIINDKQFKILLVSKKEEYFIRIIDEEKKGVINIYFEKDKENISRDKLKITTDGFGSDTYDKEMLYYGVNEKEYIVINEKSIEEKLRELDLFRFMIL